MRRSLLVACCFLVFAFGSVAVFAQRPQATVQIPFAFTAAGNELPAGTYLITTDKSNPGLLVIRSEKGNQSGLCPVMTRLSPSESPKPQLVFDKVGEKRILSEVYLPGMDGFQLAGTTSEHTHQKVSGEAK